MRLAIVMISGMLALVGASSAATPTYEGYHFPLASFKPVQDPTAHGDAYFTVDFANGTASICWQFGVFTRERTRYVYFRNAPAGRSGPIVDTFDLAPRVVGWEKMPWSGSTGFSGCRALRYRIARALVQAPRNFYLEARSTAYLRAARAQLRGPAKRCPSFVNCS